MKRFVGAALLVGFVIAATARGGCQLVGRRIHLDGDSRLRTSLAAGTTSVLQTVLPYVARAIGSALIAPIVTFVPEGSHRPESGRPHG